MDRRKFNKGTIGNNGGRPSKADEQKLVEKLSPLEDNVLKALDEAIEDKQGWAIKIWFQYRYGMPKQQIEQTNVNNMEQPLFPDFDIRDIYKVPDEDLEKEHNG